MFNNFENMESCKIKITPIELRHQKPTDIKDCYIELFEHYLRYKVEMFAEEPILVDDPSSGWEVVYNNYDIIALKKAISGIEKSATSDKKWGVYIIISGFSNDIKMYTKTQGAAQQLYDKLCEWLFK